MRMILILIDCLAFIVHLEHVFAYLLGFWIDFTRKILSKLKSNIRGSKKTTTTKQQQQQQQQQALLPQNSKNLSTVKKDAYQ